MEDITLTQQMNENRERFILIFNENIKRDGSERLLDWLCSPKCDFFTAPAGTRVEGNAEGGLVVHSLKVYDLLCDYLRNTEVGQGLRDRAGREFTAESIAIAALLHDLYKAKTYRKDGDGLIEDIVPYGEAEKSVYMISGFMRLSDDEAFAIRYHKGFSSGAADDRKTIGSALEKFELAYALSVVYMAASFFR